MVKPFASLLRIGEVNPDDIDDFIDYWHENNVDKSLHEFLGMTKAEFVAWIKGGNYKLYDILGIEVEIPICSTCGRKMGIKTDVGIVMKSCYNGTEICDDCMLEHCVSTNCLGCRIGRYPECQHLERKKFYMEEARLKREEKEAKRQKQEEGVVDEA